MKINEQMDREVLRKALIRFLSERFRLAFEPGQIASMMMARRCIDVSIDSEDVQQGLAVLKGLDLVEEVQEPLGATRYFRITAKGIIESERLDS